MNHPGYADRSIILQCKPIRTALRAAALGLSLSCVMPAFVYAADTAAITQQQQFSIPAGALNVALEEFARVAGVNLNYSPELLSGKQSAGVQGSYKSLQALNILLQGTGLEAVAHAGGYSLKAVNSKLNVLNKISVYGRKKDDQLRYIPQTVSVLDRESFANDSANTVGEAMESVAGASRLGSSLDMFADNFQIRGFDAEQSTNGLGFRRTDHPTDLANVERIEVLKGPSSVLYGQMEPGGTINIVTKQPLDYYHAESSIELGSDNHQRVTLDVTGPINDKVRARLNLAYQDSESSLDFLDYQRVFFAPNVAIDLTDTTNLTIEGSYSANEWTAMHGGAPLEGSILSNPNGDYAKSFNPAGDDSYTERDSKDLNIRLTEAITDRIDARFSYSYVHNTADWAEYVPFGLDEDNYRSLDRLIFVGRDTYKKDHEVILDLTGEFDTGNVTHNFIVGLNYRDSDLSRPNQLHFAAPIDLFNPEYTATNLTTDSMLRDRTLLQEDEVLAGFIQDRVQVTDELQLLAGLRYTDAEQSQVTINHLAGNSRAEDSLSVSNWSSQLGMVYALNEHASIYVNRSEAFVPQQGTTSGLTPLAPEESTQFEAGLRLQLGEIALNFAGFNIKKENMAISDPLDDDFEVAQGSARSKGIELSVAGYLTPNWYLNAAYGYTDTEILNSDDEELEGNRFANIPLHTASIQSRYYIAALPGLSIGGTVRYLGDRYGDDDNSFKLPSHVRLDLAAYYAINDELQLDFLIDNALDEEIFGSGSFDGVVREPERTFMARLNYRF